jgi:TatD DNase family protein
MVHMLIDSHCHLPHEDYDKDSSTIISEAVGSGVGKMISIGTSLKDSGNALDISMLHKEVFATVGIYPHEDVDTPFLALYDGMKKIISKGKDRVVGIGECGLDITNFQGGRSVDDQKELFKLQIGLAIEADLPLIIHNRNGDSEVLEILEKYKETGLRGVVHCFVSDWEVAKKVLDLGFYLSFTGIITFPSAGDALLEVVKKVPEDRYLIETDAPYLAPQGFRGKINYPAYVRMVADRIAEIRKVPFEEVERQTYKNTCNLFLNLK